MAPGFSSLAGALLAIESLQKRRIIIPAIPLARPETKVLASGEYHQYKLRTNPTRKDSPTYKLQVPYFSHGSPGQWLKTKKNIQLVIRGQNVQE